MATRIHVNIKKYKIIYIYIFWRYKKVYYLHIIWGLWDEQSSLRLVQNGCREQVKHTGLGLLLWLRVGQVRTAIRRQERGWFESPVGVWASLSAYPGVGHKKQVRGLKAICSQIPAEFNSLSQTSFTQSPNVLFQCYHSIFS